MNGFDFDGDDFSDLLLLFDELRRRKNEKPLFVDGDGVCDCDTLGELSLL